MKPAAVASNEIYRLPAGIFSLRCRACWIALLSLCLVVASFASLDLNGSNLLSAPARSAMLRFAGEFFPPDTGTAFVARVARAAIETLAMSTMGTLLAAVLGAAASLAAARTHAADRAVLRTPARLFLNGLRAIPELVWASLLVVAAGLGPMAGTLALALHTSGVLGRLFAEVIENAPPEPAWALRVQGCREPQVLLYATLPQIAPQLVAYTLYRWENNIRAAAVLGIVGAGGLGQLLAFHLGLFQMHRTATVLLATLALVLAVDLASHLVRRRMTR